MEEQQVKPSIFRATWFNVLLLAAGLILLGSGIYTIYTATTSSLPTGYKDSLLAVGNSSTNLGNLFGTDLQKAFSGLDAKEKASQWAAAAKIIGNGLTVVSRISSELASFKTKVASFKSLSEQIKDSNTKEKSLNLANLLGDLTTHLEEIVSLENQNLKPAKKYYEALAAGKNYTLPSNLTANTAKLNVEASAVSKLGSQVVSAINDLFTLLGISQNK